MTGSLSFIESPCLTHILYQSNRFVMIYPIIAQSNLRMEISIAATS